MCPYFLHCLGSEITYKITNFRTIFEQKKKHSYILDSRTISNLWNKLINKLTNKIRGKSRTEKHAFDNSQLNLNTKLGQKWQNKKNETHIGTTDYKTHCFG